ncbi:MAG UNVERIFIED_CONTAM: hypothetical protein LVR18_01435 [Planctomycetaceae bacterium]
MSSLQGKYFPLADEPSPADLAALNVEDRVGVRAVATGEFRPPRKGEWLLSGSDIEAYRAENDLARPTISPGWHWFSDVQQLRVSRKKRLRL